MRKITFGERLRYAFDNSLSGGTTSLIGWLALITLIMILVAGTLLFVTGLKPESDEPQAVAEQTPENEPKVDNETAATPASDDAKPKVDEKPAESEGFSFAEATWQSLMHSLDAGAVAGDTGWAYRGFMFLVTIGGIFIVSALIGIISSGLDNKFEELRKGRSFVVEENHVLILGWSSRIFLVISELVTANESAKKPRIVILADKDKVEMEDEIRSKVEDLKNTKVICRSGSPIDLTDLEIVNPHQAKSIIILSPEDAPEPDSQVIKMILAITNNPNRHAEKYHIVAEIQDKKNMDVAAIVGKDEAKLVLSGDLIARITVQTCRQTGLSVVYKELLDFGGDEIYFHEEPQLVGKTFGESLSAFETSSVIGVRSEIGGITINPSTSTIILNGDKLIVIAEDESKIKLSGITDFAINRAAIRQNSVETPSAENILILGWNAKGKTIVRELDNYVAPDSVLRIVSETPETETDLHDVDKSLRNLKIELQTGDTANRALLDSLDLVSYQHIIILCYAETLEVQAADAKTLITLLHLRDIEEKKGEAFSVVSEMLDVRNRALAEVTKADDFIVSDELTGLMLTQVAENGELLQVFNELFNAHGSEIYLKNSSNYIANGESVNFHTIIEAAKSRNEIAIGYRLSHQIDNADKSYGVRVNPPKSDNVTFTSGDKIIVLAES